MVKGEALIWMFFNINYHRNLFLLWNFILIWKSHHRETLIKILKDGKLSNLIIFDHFISFTKTKTREFQIKFYVSLLCSYWIKKIILLHCVNKWNEAVFSFSKEYEKLKYFIMKILEFFHSFLSTCKLFSQATSPLE